MKAFLRAARHYYLFTVAIVTLLVALGLQIGGLHTQQVFCLPL
jgi:hypothetical protein